MVLDFESSVASDFIENKSDRWRNVSVWIEFKPNPNISLLNCVKLSFTHTHTHQMYCIQCTQVDCIYFIFLCFVWIELVLQFKYFYLFPEHSTGKTIVWCSSKFVPNKRKREIVETLKSSAYFSTTTTTTITHKNPKPILITYMQTHLKLIERQ